MMELYRDYTIEEGQCCFWQVGLLSLWIKKRHNEWLLAKKYETIRQKTLFVNDAPEPDDVQWLRIFTNKKSHIVRFTPILPDRPVVVFSKEYIQILEKQKTTFFVEIPIWLKISLIDISEQIFSEIPSEILSNTWFGDTTAGVLAYSLNSYLQSDLEFSLISEPSVVCPIDIKNSSKKLFAFNKISVYSNYLNIYQGKRRYWTNEVNINFQEEDKVNINIIEKKPELEPDVHLLSRQRNSKNKHLLKKSLDVVWQSVTGNY